MDRYDDCQPTAAPRCLADIIGLWTQARLRLPTQSEVADLLCRDMPVDAVHRALSPWRIVVYEAVRQPVYRPLLVGIDECGSPWVSAQIVAIDAGRRLALTGSATTYRLSPVRAAGEPGSRELAALAQALWAWGVGEALRVWRPEDDGADDAD